ncbi:hypothetical protein Bca101_054122 [Brassica carinata]
MVLRGEMTTTRRPERPKSLHNFTLSNLKWGSQRHLKCTKNTGSTSIGSGSGDHRLRRRSSSLRFAGSSVPIPFRFRSQHRRGATFESAENGGGEEEEEEEEGIEEFRVKIMSDLKTVRDRITQSMYALKEQQHEEEEEERKPGGGSDGQEKEKERDVSPAKPWNLRKRRADACKEPVEERTANPSPPPARNDSTRGGAVVEAETATRPKFSVKLSKKEIEEDFMAALGRRPPRRPKKRPRTVQKKLDSLYPGFYLTEVTPDAYKVPEETKV